MKAGGADLRIIDRKIDSPDEENWRGTLVANARRIADIATDDNPLTAYITIGIFQGGASSIAYRYDAERCGVPWLLFPAWVAEIIRRDAVNDPQAREIFDEMFEWQE